MKIYHTKISRPTVLSLSLGTPMSAFIMCIQTIPTDQSDYFITGTVTVIIGYLWGPCTECQICLVSVC